MKRTTDPQALGEQVADILLIHAYDEDDAPTTFAAVTLVIEALGHALRIVRARRAILVRSAQDVKGRNKLAAFFGTTTGVINLILRHK